MTTYEFVRNLFDADRNGVGRITVEDAALDLRNFRAEGWDLPDDITPEAYAEIWNGFLPESKTIFTTESSRKDGDSFTICVSFVKQEALQAADMERYHLTPRERKGTTTSVQSFTVDVLPGESAKAAYDRLLDADEWPYDPETCEVVTGDDEKNEYIDRVCADRVGELGRLTPASADTLLAQLRRASQLYGGFPADLTARQLLERWNDQIDSGVIAVEG